jgi:NADPH:quinone reductase-like Zn-dependent oxidoreductase
MKAIIHERYGPPEVLRYGDVDRPVPKENEVLVRVHAASVNARDWHVLRGDPYLARLMAGDLGVRAPKQRILGTDFAGRVEAVGARVTRLRPGDEVYGESAGAFAEYVCAPAEVVDHRPKNVSVEQAAAVPLAGNTALMGIRDAARVRSGQRVLINGASGGVGLFAVQIAASLGAEVTGVCSARNADLVRSAGAAHVVDYAHDDFAQGHARYHVVFDLVGNRSLAECRRVLVPGGTLILSGGGAPAGRTQAFGPMGLFIRGTLASKVVRRHRLVILQAAQSVANLGALRELVESGAVTPVIDRTFPLKETADAIRYVEREHARAKVILTV